LSLKQFTVEFSYEERLEAYDSRKYDDERRNQKLKVAMAQINSTVGDLKGELSHGYIQSTEGSAETIIPKNFKNEMKIIALSLMKGRIKDEESFVVGLDTFSPKLVERFAKEGARPNFKRIMDNGSFSKALSAIPAQTPENWTTIATGSWLGTRGIAVWGRHSYDKPVTEKYGGKVSLRSRRKARFKKNLPRLL